MKKIIWTRSAQNDLARIDDFYADFDLEYAAKVGFLAIQSARFLLKNPHVGSFVADSDLRKWRVRKTMYILLYLATDDGIAISRIHHAREDWQREFE
jgi:toxin ParE1/3/4